MAQVLNASNTSGVYITLETTPGTYVAPTVYDFVQTVGTPKFTPRGPGIIRRADVMTPYGGELAAKTGGIGWDISFTTETYWNFLTGVPGNFTADPTGSNTPLYALFRSCPFKIAAGATDNDFKFISQAIYDLAGTRTGGNAYSTSTFSIAYEESPSGKKYEAAGCVCIPKFSFEAGGKIMIEWSIKGLWRPVGSVVASTAFQPTITAGLPLIGINASLSTTGPLSSATGALAKVSYDPGFALSDVLDAQQTYGMGIAMIALTSSPSIEIEVADLSETAQGDWTQAQANTVSSTALTVTVAIASNTSVVFSLNEPQLVQWPTPGESNGYRNIGLKFAGIVNSNSVTDIGSVSFNAPS
jgi:hypothetical protein